MTKTKNINPLFATDGYKIGHIQQYHPKTELIFSNFTPRADKLFKHYADDAPRGVLFVGIQGVVKNFIIDLWNEGFFERDRAEVVNEYKNFVKGYLGIDMDVTHIGKLHDLGYLPIEIRALPEGTICPIQVPCYTIHNTHPDFAWLTNYFETALSAETWKVITNATTAFQYRLMAEKYAEITCDNTLHMPWQCHDFSARGLSGIRDSYHTGIGHLASFMGTDSVLAIQYANDYYNMEGEFVGGSVPASEHSVATTNIGVIVNKLKEHFPHLENDIDQLRFLAETDFIDTYATEIYSKGIASYVADSYDFWSVVTKILPNLKDKIMERDGKLVIRPDSGDPVKVVAGYYVESFKDWSTLQVSSVSVLTEVVYLEDRDKYYDITGGRTINASLQSWYEIPRHEAIGAISCLWENFGGTVNSKGYKELDSHIGLIYGDSISVERFKEISERLKRKGFASNNVVYGVGSFSYNYNTRDTFGFACKATGAIIDGEEILVSKEPKTDVKKRSAKGFLSVLKDEEDGSYFLQDGLSFKDINTKDNQLEVIFRDGVLVKDVSLKDIRENVEKEVKKYLTSL